MHGVLAGGAFALAVAILPLAFDIDPVRWRELLCIAVAGWAFFGMRWIYETFLHSHPNPTWKQRGTVGISVLGTLLIVGTGGACFFAPQPKNYVREIFERLDRIEAEVQNKQSLPPILPAAKVPFQMIDFSAPELPVPEITEPSGVVIVVKEKVIQAPAPQTQTVSSWLAKESGSPLITENNIPLSALSAANTFEPATYKPFVTCPMGQQPNFLGEKCLPACPKGQSYGIADICTTVFDEAAATSNLFGSLCPSGQEFDFYQRKCAAICPLGEIRELGKCMHFPDGFITPLTANPLSPTPQASR